MRSRWDALFMDRARRIPAFALLAVLIAAPLAIGLGARTAPVAADPKLRDLGSAAPESVGISSERLKRIEAAMKRTVDEKRIAGIVTLLERHGKIVHFNAVGQKDVRKADPV